MDSVTTAHKHKIVFLGNISVGKTSILNRYVHDSFLEEYQPTVGIDFVTKTVPLPDKSANLQLQLWDTAGQERFQSVIPIYIKDSSISVIVFDLTDIKSYEAVQKWAQEIRTLRGDNVIAYLLGNKSDLKESRKVLYEDGVKKAGELSLTGYYEISAKTGYGISKFFDDVVKILSDNIPVKETEGQKLEAEQPKATNKESKCGC